MQVQSPGSREIEEPLVCGGVKADGDRGENKIIFPPIFLSPPSLAFPQTVLGKVTASRSHWRGREQLTVLHHQQGFSAPGGTSCDGGGWRRNWRLNSTINLDERLAFT